MYCQLDYLGRCLPGRIQHALDEPSETLDATYERTLREIDNANWEFAQRLLQCVAMAARPLRVEELAEFLAFNCKAAPIPKYHEGWRLEDPLEAVLSTCSTFLALVNVGRSPVIQFSHFLVKEFLTSTRFSEKRDIVSCRYHISLTPSHTLLAQACLGILLHLGEKITREGLTRFPLARYAAEHWFKHARVEGVSQNADEVTKQLFDRRKPHLAVWLWIHDPSIPYWRGDKLAEAPSPPVGTPLHYAAFCGLHDVVEKKSWPQSTPRTRTLRALMTSQRPCIKLQKRVMVKSHGSSSSTAPTWQRRRRTDRHHCIGRLNGVMWRWLGSSSSIALTPQLTVGSRPTTGRLRCIERPERVEMARFLLEHGASTAAQNEDGSTSLAASGVLEGLCGAGPDPPRARR